MQDPYLGQIIAEKYRLEERLGGGSFGTVYRAVHRVTQGNLAVKLLRTDLAQDETATRRFFAEGRLTHKLIHPNTVRLFDFGQTEQGALYMVMEYVRGRTLSRVTKQEGRLAPRRVVHLLTQILQSLSEAHALGIVHRDIKPGNLVIAEGVVGDPDFVKVLDFGIAHVADATGTRTDSPVGTPRYMAPEQWRAGEVDGRTDLYALGCLAYELLSGTLPYPLPDPSGLGPQALFVAHAFYPALPLLEIGPGLCPPPLAALVHDLLGKELGERPASADVVLTRLATIPLGSLATAPAQLEVEPAVRARAVPPPSLDAARDPVSEPSLLYLESRGGAAPTAFEQTLTGREKSHPPDAALPGPAAPTRSPGLAPRRGWLMPAAVALGVGTGIFVPGVIWLAAEPPAAPALESPPRDTEPVPGGAFEPPVAAQPAVPVPAPAASAATPEPPPEPPPESRRAPLAAPEPKVLHIDSDPSGAAVTLLATGEALGTTPFEWPVPEALAAELGGAGKPTLELKLGDRRARHRLGAGDLEAGSIRVALKRPASGPKPTDIPGIRVD